MPETQILEGEVVIECDHPKDCMYSFFPANRKIRSRFIPSRVGLKAPGAYSEFPIEGIPGERIHLDEKKKIARITDPLDDKKNEAMFERIKRADKNLSQSPNKMPQLPENVTACREVRFENLTKEDIWTWKFWMAQMLEGKRYHADYYKNPAEEHPKIVPSARLIQGKLPTQAKCIASGMVKKPSYLRGNVFDRSAQYIKPRETAEV